MKFKNISPVEKHVEKLVLLLGIVFLGYVVWTYTLSSRFTADLNGQPTAPSEIDNQIATQARLLESRLNGPAPSILTEWKNPDYVGLFTHDLFAPLTPTGPKGQPSAQQLAVSFVPGNGIPLTDVPPPIKGEEARPYAVPTMPVPTDIAVRSDLGTLDPQNNTADVLRSFGSQAPFDVRWVTVAARIDMASLMDQLHQTSSEDKQVIPQNLWGEMLALVDVQVERRVRNPDGSWSDPVLVSPMFDRFSARSALNDVTPQTVRSIVEAVKIHQLQIVQPDFYALRNSVWTPPELPTPGTADVAPGTPGTPAAGSVNLTELRRQLNDATNSINRYQQLLEAARTANRPAQVAQLQNTINAIQRNIDKLNQQIAAATGTPAPGAAGFPGMPTPGTPMPMPGAESPTVASSIFAQDKLICWANDMSIDPGKTYQYRIRLAFSNPLFHQPVADSQKDLAAQFLLNSEWSGWSEPITTVQTSYFFVLSGNTALRSARMEVWKFYDGLWRKYEDNIFPGDPIGQSTDQYTDLTPPPAPAPGAAAMPVAPGPKPVIDFTTGAVLIDTDFAYRVLIPSLNVSQTTLRVLYSADGELSSRTELTDRARRDELLKRIAPDAGVSAPDSPTPPRAVRTPPRPMGNEMPPEFMSPVPGGPGTPGTRTR